MPNNYTKEWIKGKRSVVYNFFSYMLLNELSGDDLDHFMENLIEPGIDSAEGSEALSEISDFLSGHETDPALLEELAADYTALFLGLRRNSPHPYGSFYLGKAGIVMDEEYEKVAELFSKWGVGVADNLCEPCDHIGLELAFMAHTSKMIEELIDEAKNSEALRIIALQYDFLKKHINSWFPNFVRDAEQVETKYPFYPCIVRFLSEFLQSEERNLFSRLK